MELDHSAPEVMQMFYKRLFPCKSIFAWLSHSHHPTKLFTHREFAFTLPGDVYLRYQSFFTADDLVKQLAVQVPTRFEIGPVYSSQPKNKRTCRPGSFYPVQRELVFDIDMSDYDNVRTCCSAADICDRCWGFIAAAVRVLHHALTDYFGFRRLLWVYSGRRGIHAWVSDRAAMELTDDQRRAVVGFLALSLGSKDSGGRRLSNVRVGPPGRAALPPSLQSALKLLSSTFFTDLILHEQDCFRTAPGWEALLDMVPNTETAARLRRQWSSASSSTSSTQKWADLKTEAAGASAHVRAQLMTALEDVVLTYTYPRLDAEVSKHRNHLLKAPFCVHPKTGRVCVPVDPDRVEEFKVGEVPTVARLLKELDEAGPDPATKSGRDWERTSLKPYVDLLDRHAQDIMDDVRMGMRDKGDMSW